MTRSLFSVITFALLMLVAGCSSFPKSAESTTPPDPNAPVALAADIEQFRQRDGAACILPSGKTLRIKFFVRPLSGEGPRLELTVSATLDDNEFLRVYLIGNNTGGKGDVYTKAGGIWTVKRGITDRDIGAIVEPFFRSSFTNEELLYCQQHNVQ